MLCTLVTLKLDVYRCCLPFNNDRSVVHLLKRVQPGSVSYCQWNVRSVRFCKFISQRRPKRTHGNTNNTVLNYSLVCCVPWSR